MRILYWTHSFWPYIGGVEVLSTHFLSAIKQRDHDLMVVTSHGDLDLPDVEEYEGIPVYRFPFWNALNHKKADYIMDVLQRVGRLKRAFKPDLVHVNLPDPGVFFHLHTYASHAAPMVASLHSWFRPDQMFKHKALHIRSLKTADWVVSCSEAMLKETLQLVPQIDSRSSVIYNGIDANNYNPEPAPTNPFSLLCLGRLVEDKGFALALNALADIIDQFPNTRMFIAGDGPEMGNLKQRVKDLGITHYVEFVGLVAPEEVPDLFNAASVVLMPSRSEGLPLVAIQSALMARPIIATRVGGIPEIVIHRETGWLIEKDDTNALIKAITYLFNHPEKARNMGQMARIRAQKQFSLTKYVNAYENLYQNVINGGVM